MRSIEVMMSAGFCAVSFIATTAMLSGCGDCAGHTCPELEVDGGTYQVVSEQVPDWASAIGDVVLTDSTLTINYTDSNGEDAVAVWTVE